ncbi:hypothetical protein [Staphylococcus agnetis]|uniref:Uncharacterized protein n=1 Tax=Staphylococcus agnetis TaxID=985762 RepID=A0ABD7TS81_9STAP|nr:hypothetical protein [Staphylococcus agnetis]UXU56514.1 hypothetical protein MUA95_08035 [Staphylococcus agnetis]UXU58834.1 hypothetical protein MUA97_08040 [Staphylococcus agnetis]UXU61159.1 hypothetical protein MUA43_08040 [Staphylococcus agnetis]
MEIKSTLDVLSEAGVMHLNGEVEDIVVCIKKPNNDVTVMHSPMFSLEVVGLLEMSKYMSMEE